MIFSSDPTINLISDRGIPVSEAIFIAEDMVIADDQFFVLDAKSFLLVKMDKNGKQLAKAGGRGQGPGEFFNPWSVAAGDGKIFVGDIYKIHVFNATNLQFEDQIKVVNNSPSLLYDQGELFLGLVNYPNAKDGVYVYDFDGNVRRTFYDCQCEDPPYLAMQAGRLYVLSHLEYRVDVFDRLGKPLNGIALKPSGQYKEVIPFEPMRKKMGDSYATYLKWLSKFSKPSRVAVSDGFLWVCFGELQNDLRSTNYYVDIYDLSNNSKVVSWKKMNGRLYRGGEKAWFIEETPQSDGGYGLEIKGYRVERKP